MFHFTEYHSSILRFLFVQIYVKFPLYFPSDAMNCVPTIKKIIAVIHYWIIGIIFPNMIFFVFLHFDFSVTEIM